MKFEKVILYICRVRFIMRYRANMANLDLIVILVNLILGGPDLPLGGEKFGKRTKKIELYGGRYHTYQILQQSSDVRETVLFFPTG